MGQQPPERKENGEESLVLRNKPIGRFKALTKQLLTVSRKELDEQEVKYEQKKRSEI